MRQICSSPLQPAQQVAISDLVVTRRLNLTGFTHTFMNSIVLFSIMSRGSPTCAEHASSR